MKIVVLHGSPRVGNTDYVVKHIKSVLAQMDDVSFVDFHLPKDAPVFCKGCFTCFEKGEKACPNARFIQPIAHAMEAADGLIIACPVYALQLPGALKAFLDHMAYRYLNHRPVFFHQQAMIVATTAGAGTGNVVKYLKQNLHFWGIHRIISLKITMNAGSVSEMTERRQQKLEKMIKEKSSQFSRQLKSKRVVPSVLSVLMFHISRSLQLTMPHGHADRQYWEQNGWLSPKAAYYVEGIRPGLLRSLIGRIAAKTAFR